MMGPGEVFVALIVIGGATLSLTALLPASPQAANPTTAPAAAPPYSSGTLTPMSPSSASSASCAAGKRDSRSRSPAMRFNTACA